MFHYLCVTEYHPCHMITQCNWIVHMEAHQEFIIELEKQFEDLARYSYKNL